MLRFVRHAAPPASCVSAAGSARAIATLLGFGERAPDETLLAHARTLVRNDGGVGKVDALGTWRDPVVLDQLSAVLGTLGPALRPDFEWYQCRGAFFHNDAHYDERLFGIWCIVGPRADIVFPRAGVRLACGPGSIAVFDPFEVHGVLAPDHSAYSADDYLDAEPSVFLGFELDITPALAAAFGVTAAISGRVISSRTRIAATSGALDSAS